MAETKIDERLLNQAIQQSTHPNDVAKNYIALLKDQRQEVDNNQIKEIESAISAKLDKRSEKWIDQFRHEIRKGNIDLGTDPIKKLKEIKPSDLPEAWLQDKEISNFFLNTLKPQGQQSAPSESSQSGNQSQDQTEQSPQSEATPEPEAHSTELERIRQEDQDLAKRRKEKLDEAETQPFTEPIEEENIVYGGKSFMEVATPEQKQNCKTFIYMFPDEDSRDACISEPEEISKINSLFCIGETNGISDQLRINFDNRKLHQWVIRRGDSMPFYLAAACINSQSNIRYTNMLRWCKKDESVRLAEFYTIDKMPIICYSRYATNETIVLRLDSENPIANCLVKISKGDDILFRKTIDVSENQVQIREEFPPQIIDIEIFPKDRQQYMIPTESKRIEIIQPSIGIENQNTPYIGQDIKVNLQMSNETIEWLKERTDNISLKFFHTSTLLKQEEIKPAAGQVLSIPSDEFTLRGQKQINIKLYYPDGTEIPLSGSFSVNVEKPTFEIEKINEKELSEGMKTERSQDNNYSLEIKKDPDLPEYKFFIIYGPSSNLVRKQLTEKHGKWHVEIPPEINGFILLIMLKYKLEEKVIYIVDPPEQPEQPNPEQPEQPNQEQTNKEQTNPYTTGPGQTPEKTITFPYPTPQMIPNKIIFYEGKTEHNQPKAIKFQGNEQLYLGEQINYNTDQLLIPEALFNNKRFPQLNISMNRVYLVIDRKGKGYAIGSESQIQKRMKGDYLLCHVNDIIFMIESDGRVSYKLESRGTARYLNENWYLDADSHNGLFLQTPYQNIIFGRDRIKRLEDTMQHTRPIITEQEEALETENNMDELFVKEIQEQKYLGQFLVSLKKGLSNVQNTPGIFNKQNNLDKIKESLENFMKQKESVMRTLLKDINGYEKEYLKINTEELKELSRLHMDKILETTGNEKATQEWNNLQIKKHHEELIEGCKGILKSLKEKYDALKEKEFKLLDGLTELYNQFIKKETLDQKIGELIAHVDELIRYDKDVIGLIAEIETLEAQRESKLEELTRALPALHKAFIQSNHTRAKDYIQKEVQF